MEGLSRRSALTVALAAPFAVPLLTISGPARAEVPKYGPTDGMDIGRGRRMIEVGTQESQIDAYKQLKIIDIYYPAGASDSPDDPPMDVDMMCFIIAGAFTIQKTGLEPYTVNEGGFYSCGKGKKDLATNISGGVGIHRIAMLIPA